MRIHVLPDDFPFGGHFEEASKDPFVDESVAIGQPLRIRDSRTEETRDYRLLVFPSDLFRGGFDLDHAREIEAFIQAMWAVIENQNVAIG